MTRILYYTEPAVAVLRAKVDRHLDWYYRQGGEPPTPGGVENAERKSLLHQEDLSTLLYTGGEPPPQSDAKNAIAMYRALHGIEPKDAADERLWVHLCHTQCVDYVAARWLGKRPDSKAEAVRKVHNHFFARDNRAIIRDNGLSRLWWLGYIAHRVSGADPGLFLEILLHRQDIRSALIERPSVSMAMNVLGAVYGVMHEHWQLDGPKSPVFKREVFRAWMVGLNRRGGLILLDAVSGSSLENIVREEAGSALRKFDDG